MNYLNSSLDKDRIEAKEVIRPRITQSDIAKSTKEFILVKNLLSGLMTSS